jgi:KaiC/GvpD/RAD55 family RecA-like ATPase
MHTKDKFLSALKKKLNPNQRQLLTLIEIVGTGKDALVFKMPKDVISLAVVWEKIEETGNDLKIRVSQTAGEYATLEDLDKIMGEIEWLWKNWIPRGMVTMLAGDPGVGKSAIAQHFAKIVTKGECFPLEDKPFGKPANVVWIDTEASQQILKVRANTMNLDKSRVYIPAIDGDMMSQPDLAIASNKEYLDNMVRDLKPSLLVLDSLGGSHTRGENKVEDIKPVLEWMALLARNNNVASIVIHHLNKGHKDESPEVSLYRIRGSTIIPAMCRSIFAIEPTHDKLLKLRVIKTNIAKTPEAITVKPMMNHDGDFTGFEYGAYTAPPGKKNRKDIVAEWLMSQLEAHKDGIAVKEITDMGEEMGYTRQIIYTARDIIGGRMYTTGTGNRAFWHLYSDDVDTIDSIKMMVSGGNGKSLKAKNEVKSGRKTKNS